MHVRLELDVLRARRDHSLRPEDAALARELIFGVLRWQRLLDALLARNIRVGVRTIEPDVRLALRLGEDARIIAPAELAAQVGADAAAALAQYAS